MGHKIFLIKVFFGQESIKELTQIGFIDPKSLENFLMAKNQIFHFLASKKFAGFFRISRKVERKN